MTRDDKDKTNEHPAPGESYKFTHKANYGKYKRKGGAGAGAGAGAGREPGRAGAPAAKPSGGPGVKRT